MYVVGNDAVGIGFVENPHKKLAKGRMHERFCRPYETIFKTGQSWLLP
jgi:hypothetical protein